MQARFGGSGASCFTANLSRRVGGVLFYSSSRLVSFLFLSLPVSRRAREDEVFVPRPILSAEHYDVRSSSRAERGRKYREKRRRNAMTRRKTACRPSFSFSFSRIISCADISSPHNFRI